MKDGGFIPENLYIEVREELDPAFINGVWTSQYSELRKKKILFCDILVYEEIIYMDQYYDRNHALNQRITELELQAIDGFETYQKGKSAEIYNEVFKKDLC